MTIRKNRILSLDSLLLVLTLIALVCLILSYFSPFANPKTYRFIPLFGLFYPAILLSVGLALTYWLLRKRWKTSIFILLILLIGLPFHARFFATSSSRQDDTTRFISIMSYNVRLFDVYNWFERGDTTKQDIFNYLETTNTDIVCFQEYYYENEPTNFETTQKISRILNAPYHYGRYTSGSKGKTHFGVMTISKFPIVETGYVDLNSAASNHCIYTDIIKDSIRFRVYNLHIGSIQIQDDEYDLFSDKPNSLEEDKAVRSKRLLGRLLGAFRKRKDQVEAILTHSQNSPYPVIICGDFNDTPLSHAYHRFYGLYQDAFLAAGSGIGTTYAGKIPANRIDFIFYDNTFNALTFHIQKEVYSDHRAIWTELELSH